MVSPGLYLVETYLEEDTALLGGESDIPDRKRFVIADNRGQFPLKILTGNKEPPDMLDFTENLAERT